MNEYKPEINGELVNNPKEDWDKPVIVFHRINQADSNESRMAVGEIVKRGSQVEKIRVFVERQIK